MSLKGPRVRNACDQSFMCLSGALFHINDDIQNTYQTYYNVPLSECLFLTFFVNAYDI